MNLKKRYYDDVKTLNKDYDALLELKNEEQSMKRKNASEKKNEIL